MSLNELQISSVINAMQVYSPKGIKAYMQNRPHYALSFAKSGRITYVQNGQSFVSDSTTAVLLPKGGTYTILRQETGVFPLINFECVTDIGHEIRVFSLEQADRMYELYETLQKRSLQGDRLAVMAALYHMFSLLIEQKKRDPATAVKDYISRHIGESTLTSAQVAKAMNVSSGYLERLFGQHMGTTPKQYIIRYRIEKAKRLLAENYYSIGKISEECGYASVYSFSRAFKQYMGMSPSSYRETSGNVFL